MNAFYIVVRDAGNTVASSPYVTKYSEYQSALAQAEASAAANPGEGFVIMLANERVMTAAPSKPPLDHKFYIQD